MSARTDTAPATFVAVFAVGEFILRSAIPSIFIAELIAAQGIVRAAAPIDAPISHRFSF
jgi:hypothetical protein